MKNKTLLIVRTLSLFILTGICCTSKIYGNTPPSTFEEVIRRADLIVIGKITRVESTSIKLREQLDLREYHVGEIEVTKILKGEISKSGTIKLGWPDLGTKEKDLLKSSPPRLLQSSCSPDVIYKEGDSGIWILRKDPKVNLYYAEDHQGQSLQPLSKKESILKIIRDQNTQSLSKNTQSLSKVDTLWKL